MWQERMRRSSERRKCSGVRLLGLLLAVTVLPAVDGSLSLTSSRPELWSRRQPLPLLLEQRGGAATQSSRWGAPQPGGGQGWSPGSSGPRPEAPSPWSLKDLDTRTVVLEPRTVANLKQRDSRVGLIRKVYGILGVQLLVTAAVCYLFLQDRSIPAWLMSDSGSWALLLAFATALGSAIFLSFPGVCRRMPLNLLLLGLFTGGESVFIASITSMFRVKSVLLAAAQTGVATLGLTAYAFQRNPKYDLTAFGGSLASALCIFASSVLLTTIFKVPVPDAAVGGVGALLFSIFLVYDTQRIVGGPDKAVQLDDRDYVRGALELYLDITRIFLYLLRTFGKREGGFDD